MRCPERYHKTVLLRKQLTVHAQAYGNMLNMESARLAPPVSQVANDDKSGCKYCKAGFVRDTQADGTLPQDCVAAKTTAGPCPLATQYAQEYGKCRACPTSQKVNDGKTDCVYV